MGSLINYQNKNRENLPRKIYIDLLSNEKIKQPENFCGNSIKTTQYTM
jgi:hypothetical protein